MRSDSLWDRVRAQRAYRRLHDRERGIGRAFTDSAFRAFLDRDVSVDRAAALRATLTAWEAADLAAAEARARAYLTPGATIRATVHVMIKPRPNSFVFDLGGDPAIMLYLDPAMTEAQFANVVTHELHHIGYGSACAERPPMGNAAVRRWLSAFGEGWAMLAAAGGPDVHPHAVSADSTRAVWDRDLAMAASDMPRLERFFLELLDGGLDEQAASARGMGFFAERPQGPWYTVGWLMTSTVERAEGRAALLEVLCDPVALIERYQRAAQRTGAPRWSQTFVARLRG